MKKWKNVFCHTVKKQILILLKCISHKKNLKSKGTSHSSNKYWWWWNFIFSLDSNALKHNNHFVVIAAYLRKSIGFHIQIPINFTTKKETSNYLLESSNNKWTSCSPSVFNKNISHVIFLRWAISWKSNVSLSEG